MAKKAVTFASVLQNPIYKNRDVLYALVPPTGLLHRTEQKNELIMELAPILMDSAVSCVFVYGNPGTGKTAIITELLGELSDEAKKRKVKLLKAYVNCSENRTETTILVDILSQINPKKTYPRVGWTRAKALSEFKKVTNELKTNIIVVLDEIDYALKESGDDIIYRLSRVNEKLDSRVSTILVSNDVRVADYIKPRTQSTLGRVRVIFAPYAAEELYDILKDRVKYAFNRDSVSDQVVKKVAEIEASRGGDARKALELLDSCSKIAISKNSSKVTLDLVDAADKTLEKDTIFNMVTTLTKHQKLLYLAMIKSKKKDLDGGKVYKMYKEVCEKQNVSPLSVRSIRTFLVNFSELGLIQSEVTWLRNLRKKSRTIRLEMDTATRKKLRKVIRDSI
ncbi:AAA family ATPase [Candidatus Woesearchaeota archaeon]|nr:AAA family ATPase [Candidatus Woesearchaeota archaeon]